MQNRWESAQAPGNDDPLGQCVHGSRLLGAEPTLVLHGGGNTSIKTTVDDVTGDPVDVLYVKGSGWDLATIERAGFTALRLDRLRSLLRLDRLSDTAMMNELRGARLDAGAPDPSVESLLHALLPYPAVLHSHADALIALTNQPDGAARGGRGLRGRRGRRAVRDARLRPGPPVRRDRAGAAHPGTVGLVLLNHGLFTFGATTEEAYRRHIALIDRAERFLAGRVSERPVPTPAPARPDVEPVELARLRRRLSDLAGMPLVVGRHDDPLVRGFVTRQDLADVAGRGPLTPDHVIRTKRVPLVGRDLDGYAARLSGVFRREP